METVLMYIKDTLEGYFEQVKTYLEQDIQTEGSEWIRTANEYRRELNISWEEHMTNKELYGGIPPISQTIKMQRMRFAGHVWRNKNELASDVLLWEPTHGKQKPGRPKRSYIDQLTDDTGCNAQELKNAMDNKLEWRKRVTQCRASSIR